MFELYRKLTKDQKIFLFLCLGFSFLITLDYSCLRPASTALFITHFGSKWLPWVWLISLPINFLTVSFFNKAQSRIGSKTLTRVFPWIVLTLNLALTLLIPQHKLFSLALFIWKDLYILLMFQQLWSQIHASWGEKIPRSFYALMYGIGAVGSIVGSSIPAYFAMKSHLYLYSTLFIYPLIAWLQALLNRSPISSPFEKKQNPSATDGLKQIFGSHDLITIGLLVAFMQMMSALSEFNFSYHLEHKFLDLSTRTQASAKIMSYMHALTLGIQMLLAIVSLERLGIKRGHKMIPVVLGSTSLVYLFFPTFTTASLTYVGCKSLDFSLFSVLKESLYAPLDKAYKYQAKSFIDIFVYRGAKTVMSFGLILFSFLHSAIFFGVILFLMATVWFFIARSRLKSFELKRL